MLAVAILLPGGCATYPETDVTAEYLRTPEARRGYKVGAIYELQSDFFICQMDRPYYAFLKPDQIGVPTIAAWDSGNRKTSSVYKIIGPIRSGTRLRVEKILFFKTRIGDEVTGMLRADGFAQLIAPAAVSNFDFKHGPVMTLPDPRYLKEVPSELAFRRTALLGRLNAALATMDEAEVDEVRRELEALNFHDVVTRNEVFGLWLAAFAHISLHHGINFSPSATARFFEELRQGNRTELGFEPVSGELGRRLVPQIQPTPEVMRQYFLSKLLQEWVPEIARFRDAHFADNEAAIIKAMVDEEVREFSGRARLDAELKLPTKTEK